MTDKLATHPFNRRSQSNMNSHFIINHICQWLDKYCQTANSAGFVIGVSGGIDSAVVSTLAAKTGRPTLCLQMPIHQYASQDTRAKRHIENLANKYLNVTTTRVDLSAAFDCFIDTLSNTDTPQQSLASANARARLRMTTLYYFAGLHNYLVVGTGNKVEDFGVGFYTKYGDGGVDLSPIADLMKSQVYQLGTELAVIDEIMQAPPTDGLWGDDRTDEDQLGASYDELEWAMTFDQKKPDDSLTPRQQQVLTIYRRLHQANKHKMTAIPVCEIPATLKS